MNFSPFPENTLMPLSSNGLCDAEITTPASKELARQIRHRRRRHDAGARHLRPFADRAVRELGLDPGARLARVAADEQMRRPGAVRQRAHERRAEPPDGGSIEWVLAGRPADAVGSEQTC